MTPEVPPQISKMFDDIELRHQKEVEIKFNLSTTQAIEVIKFVEELTKR